MMFWLSNRLLKQPASKAAGDCFDLRTPLEGCFSSRQVVAC
jgi:hypothetical protein